MFQSISLSLFLLPLFAFSLEISFTLIIPIHPPPCIQPISIILSNIIAFKYLRLGAPSFHCSELSFSNNIMAVVRFNESSSSICYDVFLSFRGEDTRTTFTDHLYTALDQQGFRTFRDDDEMEKGEYLKSELENAIPQSKSSIIVISENYASSTWCLDELVIILERRRNSNHIVLPVFYHTDPSEVRKQTGRMAETFARYEEHFEEETDSEKKRMLREKINGWRSALIEVADLIGLDLKNQADRVETKWGRELPSWVFSNSLRIF
ncbi:hypothetical protein LguiA_007537 [Lonicera macranthoides]